MQRSLARIAGLSLVAGALLGLLLSLTGLVGLALFFPQLQQASTRELVSLDRALATTGDGLLLASVSLGEAEVAINTLHTTIRSSGQTITDTLPTLAALTTLTEADFPRTVRSTQAALASARETAAVADSVLSAVSSLPFIGSAIYNPAVPLNVAIGEVSASLDPIPASLNEVAQGLRVADTNLRQIGTDLDQLARGVRAIGTSVSATNQVLTSYQGIVNDLRSRLDQLRAALPVWIGVGGLGLFLLLIWFAIAQLSLLMQGMALLRRS